MHPKPTGKDDRTAEAGGVAVAPGLAEPSDLQLLSEFANTWEYEMARSRADRCLVAPSQNGL